ncbi:MAG: 50S ribosomal protein L25 [Rhodothermus sp.]|nr:50S ribosomal protein L25 [Rhodothermus sp.]
MMTITIEAQLRETGKRVARAIRRQGWVPCILYGHHVEPIPFQIPESKLWPLIYTTETHLIKLQLNGQTWDCILKDVEFHPVTDRPIHADFQVLQQTEKITVTVPVRTVGTAVGVQRGGVLQLVTHELEVTCLPKDIPAHIDIDVTNLDIGDAVHVGDLQFEGLKFEDAPDQTVVVIAAPQVGGVEEEEGAEGEAGAAEAGTGTSA